MEQSGVNPFLSQFRDFTRSPLALTNTSYRMQQCDDVSNVPVLETKDQSGVSCDQPAPKGGVRALLGEKSVALHTA